MPHRRGQKSSRSYIRDPHAAAAADEPEKSWAARATALRRETAANLTMLAAILAVLSAFCGWIAVLVPLGSNPRGSPAFWLLAIPLLCWTTPLLGFRAWAVNTVGLALAAAPMLALAALLTAENLNGNQSLLQETQSLDTPGAMRIVLGVTVLMSLAGLLALRRDRKSVV